MSKAKEEKIGRFTTIDLDETEEEKSTTKKLRPSAKQLELEQAKIINLKQDMFYRLQKECNGNDNLFTKKYTEFLQTLPSESPKNRPSNTNVTNLNNNQTEQNAK